MSPVRTDLPSEGTVWRDRYSPQRTVKVTGAVSDGVRSWVIGNVLTYHTGEAPIEAVMVHTALSQWDWMYEPAGLGARA